MLYDLDQYGFATKPIWGISVPNFAAAMGAAVYTGRNRPSPTAEARAGAGEGGGGAGCDGIGLHLAMEGSGAVGGLRGTSATNRRRGRARR